MAALLLLLAGTATAQAAEVLQFNRDIPPILSDKCFACHRNRTGKQWIACSLSPV